MSEEAGGLLTVIALARNEARHLPECFASAAPLVAATQAHTLIVLDSRADTHTSEVAHRVAGSVLVSTFESFSAQRNRALDAASTPWVFFIDPDERVTPELAAEIETVLRGPACSAYRVSRRNFLFGHEVKHTGWWPDYQIRLLERDKCRYDERREVHELPEVQGQTGTLRSPLIHYNYDTWRQFFRKQWAYARYDARALHASGRRARPRSFIGQPVREFTRRFVAYEGYRDGLLGLALSLAMSFYTAETYRQLWLLQRRH